MNIVDNHICTGQTMRIESDLNGKPRKKKTFLLIISWILQFIFILTQFPTYFHSVFIVMARFSVFVDQVHSSWLIQLNSTQL